LAADDHIVLLLMHHIISDEWSMRIMLREFASLYEAYAAGRPSPLAELPVQYADYALWQRERMRGEAYAAQLAYWKRQLEGSPRVLALPTKGRSAARRRPRSSRRCWRASTFCSGSTRGRTTSSSARR
jgi:hypothetical protein